MSPEKPSRSEAETAKRLESLGWKTSYIPHQHRQGDFNVTAPDGRKSRLEVTSIGPDAGERALYHRLRSKSADIRSQHWKGKDPALDLLVDASASKVKPSQLERQFNEFVKWEAKRNRAPRLESTGYLAKDANGKPVLTQVSKAELQRRIASARHGAVQRSKPAPKTLTTKASAPPKPVVAPRPTKASVPRPPAPKPPAVKAGPPKAPPPPAPRASRPPAPKPIAKPPARAPAPRPAAPKPPVPKPPVKAPPPPTPGGPGGPRR
jgi:hypothetical protein